MRKLRLRVFPVDHKCLDTEGEWDGTYHRIYEYTIEDEENQYLVQFENSKNHKVQR